PNTFFENFGDKLVYNSYEGSLNPALMIDYLHRKAASLGVIFRLNTDIHEIDTDNNELITSGFLKMYARVICVCTNGFTRHFFPHLPVTPARNQVLMTKPLDGLNFDG